MNSVWSIAGHDPLAAAGIQADLRVGFRLGTPVRTLIASFTAQNHREVLLCTAVPESWLLAQWQVLRAEEKPAVIKLGLLPDVATIRRVGALLHELPEVAVICDPVLATSSGYSHAGPELLAAYREFIFPRLSLLTPNGPEAEQWLGYPLRTLEDRFRACAELRSWGIGAVLLKGGHGPADTAILDVFDDGKRAFCLRSERQPGSFRGTGCSLATAISCYQAQGLSLREAVIMGQALLQAAIKNSKNQNILSFDHNHNHNPAPLSPLSYDGHFHDSNFPAVTSESKGESKSASLGFYPIVPDLDWLKRLLPTGIRSIQLRLKGRDAARCAQDIATANSWCRQAGVRLFVNDYWQIACAVGAYGVHLGQEDLDQVDAQAWQQIRQQELRVGISTHSYEEAARALSYAPSYIALGPIFPSSCKSMAFGPQGIARLREWKNLCPQLPLVAIGGLRLEHAAAVFAAGADGISVISDVTEHPLPELRIRDWLRVCPT